MTDIVPCLQRQLRLTKEQELSLITSFSEMWENFKTLLEERHQLCEAIVVSFICNLDKDNRKDFVFEVLSLVKSAVFASVRPCSIYNAKT